MGEPGADHAHPGDASPLRMPTHRPRPRPTRRRRVAAVAVLAVTVAGTWGVASRTQEAMWFLPAGYVPDPTSSTVTVMVQELGCDSGAPPRIVRPRVDLDETTATIAVSTRARWELSGSCLGEAPTPLTVDLGEPLGDRVLVDAHGHLDDTWVPVEVRDPGLQAPAAADR